jgi:hypothetical protein
MAATSLSPPPVHDSTTASRDYKTNPVPTKQPFVTTSPQNMSPRLTPAPHFPDGPDHSLKYLPASAAAAAAAAVAAEKLSNTNTNKVSTPLAVAAANAIATTNQQAPAVASTASSSNGKTATTATAPAIPAEEEQLTGRPVVDPGLPGVTDNSSSRAYTYPPPLENDPHTPAPRNYSLPGSTPKNLGSLGKKHKCLYCKTEFTRHHNLKSHLLTHSQEKPYECQQCQARFRRLHDLKRHTKLHTGERPHECPTCFRRFARGDALARHAKGPGGCAGRRTSFIDGDPNAPQDGSSMEGVEYTAEPESMDDRTSPGDPKASRSDSFRPATYPGILPPGGLPSLYPGSAPRSRDHSISSQGGALAPIQQFNQSSGVFQQGVTDSPKPISPGGSGDHRTIRAIPGTSPILPPPGSNQHLPSLPPFSNPGSLSSGSAGSASRDGQSQVDLWNTISRLETSLNQQRAENDANMARLRNEHAKELAENRRALDSMRDELARLHQDRASELKAVPKAD